MIKIQNKNGVENYIIDIYIWIYIYMLLLIHDNTVQMYVCMLDI